MYKIRFKKGFATIIEDGKEIEPLSGLYMAGPEDIESLKRLVRSANRHLRTEKEGDDPNLKALDVFNLSKKLKDLARSWRERAKAVNYDIDINNLDVAADELERMIP